MGSLVPSLNVFSSSFLYTTIKASPTLLVAIHKLTGQYTAGAGLIGSTLIATGLYLFQCRLIYPSYVPQGSRIR